MALSAQAALLDELMGADRNSATKKVVTWNDENVCKFFLAGFCPHELFVNTKLTLGECPKQHSSKLLEDYKNSNLYMKMGFEQKLKRYLQRYVDDVDTKIKINLDRLKNGLLSGTEVAIKEKIKKHEKRVTELISLIEEKANEGKIEESRNLSSELEDVQKELKYDRLEYERQKDYSRDKMEDVCRTCGAYISKTDPRNSIENHMTGRIHCSYKKINEVIAELDNQIRGNRNGSNDRKESENDKRIERHRSRSKNRDRYRERSHSSKQQRHRSGSHSKRSRRRNSRSHSRGMARESPRDSRHRDGRNRRNRRD